MAKQARKKIKARKKKKRKITKNNKSNNIIKLLTVVLIILILVFISVIATVWYYSKLPVIEKETVPKKIEFTIKQPLFNATQAEAYLPAVDKEGKGVMTLLAVEAVPGSGRTLVDIDNLLFWADTQHSIRIAKNVAANITNINISNYDLVYNIYANASVIGGESAGAAITIATIAALENRSLRKDVVITGTINHDGSIGPVSGILPKAEASKEVNATLFLVPLLQGKEIVYETRQHCEKFGPTEFCTTERIPKKINISEEVGIEIREVGTIKEALEYFFEE